MCCRPIHRKAANYSMETQGDREIRDVVAASKWSGALAPPMRNGVLQRAASLAGLLFGLKG